MSVLRNHVVAQIDSVLVVISSVCCVSFDPVPTFELSNKKGNTTATMTIEALVSFATGVKRLVKKVEHSEPENPSLTTSQHLHYCKAEVKPTTNSIVLVAPMPIYPSPVAPAARLAANRVCWYSPRGFHHR